jgi:hypothetical protein
MPDEGFVARVVRVAHEAFGPAAAAASSEAPSSFATR